MKQNTLVGAFAALCLLAAAYYVFDRMQDKKAFLEAEEEVVAPGEFSFAKLKQKAQALAAMPYKKPQELPGGKFKSLDYDEYRDIRFNPQFGPWAKSKQKYDLQLFHVGGMFTAPVAIYEIVDNKTTPLTYHQEFFDYGKNKFSEDDFKTIKNGGYAGFRLHYPLNSLSYYDEVISFLGASYFRALGQGHKYGLSARGLAVDTALMKGEEFPFFTEFYIEKPRRNAREIKIYALLDSESVTGAYRFLLKPGQGTVMDVDAELYFRKPVEKLGIAPLTSMYLFGENTKNRFDDYRPEVHDSDGLLVHNGAGEWLWRPLDNAKFLRVSSFEDNNVQGFGLMQRDRSLEHYLDFEANYHERPSVWVEPKGNWGKGSVELVEIPSEQEIHDNVVAYWVPKKKIETGKPYRFKYTLNWIDDYDDAEQVEARVYATYTGVGGVMGVLGNKGRKFAVEFTGNKLRRYFGNGELEIDASASEGKIERAHLEYSTVTKGVVAYVDFEPNGKTSELRIALKREGKIISEVWTYQYLPQ